MKRIVTILLLVLATATFSFADDVKIDRSNCTITKDGKTYPLYGKVKIVDTNGSADIVVRVVESGACDLEVKKVNDGNSSYCGVWRIIESGSADLKVKIVTSGSADIKIKFIETGSGGLR